MTFKAGSLISIAESVSSGRFLGLVVDQEAGKQWMENDPCIRYMPMPEEEVEFVLVRVLGTRLVNSFLHKSPLPEKEPQETETVRWEYAQVNHSFQVAGPDLASIEEFLRWGRTFHSLGGGDGAVVHEVGLLAEYLRGVTRSKDATSWFEQRYFAMLEEVLPKQ
jgi:hypothetical protein